MSTLTLPQLIPEWPAIKADRPAIIGMKGGADHPFGALLIIVSELGLVVVNEYLERQQANITHRNAIVRTFDAQRFTDLKWAVSDAEKELQLEFALADTPVIGVPNAKTFGIQRVQSWLAADQLFFVAAKCPQALKQLRRYRYAENVMPDGQKRDKEAVFRADDELPEALGVAVLAWPELPKIPEPGLSERELKRWESLDEQSRHDIERLREYAAQSKSRDLDPNDASFPVGDFFGGANFSGKKENLW
jgi:hypothetical protein